MSYPATLAKIADRIKELPDQTQVAVAITKNGKTQYWGLLKEQNTVKQINNSTATFEIGSITKAFAGYLLSKLIIQHKVKLDDLIQQVLPFPLLNNPPITWRQLATHTSGLQRMPHDFDTQPNYNQHNPFANYTEQQLAAYCSQELRLDSLPGQQHQYSNLGYGLLSYGIAKLVGKPFAAAMAETIFQPLNMINTTFDIREVQTELVKGLDEQGKVCDHWEGGILNGCLGMLSTAEDLTRFASTIINRSDAAANLQAQEAFQVNLQLRSNLGWGEALILPENIRMQGINGGTGGYGASLLLNREKEVAVAILSNIWPSRYMEIMYPLGKELLIAHSAQ